MSRALVRVARPCDRRSRVVGLGAPIRADDDESEKAPRRRAFSWTRRDGGPTGPLIDLPPVGNQRLSYTCASWAVRTVAAFHRRRVEPRPESGAPPRGSRGRQRRVRTERDVRLQPRDLRRSALRGADANRAAGCGASGDVQAFASRDDERDTVIFTALTSRSERRRRRSAPFTTNVGALPTDEPARRSTSDCGVAGRPLWAEATRRRSKVTRITETRRLRAALARQGP